jgi:preprotein translocase subunit YajC
MDMLFWLQETPAAPAGAPATGQQPPASGAGGGQGGAFGGMGMFVPLILMFVVMYFLMLRPQRKQQKEREMMISNLKKNDHVVTHAGIYGIVKQVQDGDIILAIDESKDVRIKVAKTAIAGLVKASGAEGEAKPEGEKAKG